MQPPSGPPLYTQPRFACLAPDFRPTPLPQLPPSTMVNLTAVVVDYANPATTQLQNLSMSFCQQTDVNCMGDLVPKAVPVPNTPAVNLAVPVGSNGYLRQEAADHYRQDYYLLAPMMKDDASLVGPTKAFFLVGNDSLAGFLRDMGIAVDNTLGIMAFFIEDCDGNRVEGASLRLPEAISGTKPELREADAWAINSAFPVPGALTEADGTAGFVNVTLGTVQVEVVVDGQPYGTARLRVAGDRLTSATLRPIYNTGR